MNGPRVINPDSTILQQSEGHWQRYLTLVVWKLAKNGVTITNNDIERFIAEGEQILLTHGHVDSIEFKLITADEARRIAEYDRQQRGKA